jgi:phosphocarrier protein HPr
MVASQCAITNALGLHARAAARFVQLASRFKSQVQVTRGARTVDGKSILGLLLLAAARGTVIDLAIAGEDEQAALDALVGLIARGFEDA